MKGEVDVKLDKDELPSYLKDLAPLLRDNYIIVVEMLTKKGKTDFTLRIWADKRE